LKDSGKKLSTLASGEAGDFELLVAKCSSSFCEIPESSLSDLSVSLLGSILWHPSLRIASEDNLYEFVKNQILRDESYSALLNFIRFEYVSPDWIRDFTSLMSHSNFVCNAACHRMARTETTSKVRSQFSTSKVRSQFSAQGHFQGNCHQMKPCATVSEPFSKKFSRSTFNFCTLHFSKLSGGNDSESGARQTKPAHLSENRRRQRRL
jgi:hypothetical protein